MSTEQPGLPELKALLASDEIPDYFDVIHVAEGRKEGDPQTIEHWQGPLHVVPDPGDGLCSPVQLTHEPYARYAAACMNTAPSLLRQVAVLAQGLREAREYIMDHCTATSEAKPRAGALHRIDKVLELAQQARHGTDRLLRRGLRFLLTRIASWSYARWDQHLRDEFGDEKAEVMIFEVREIIGAEEEEP